MPNNSESRRNFLRAGLVMIPTVTLGSYGLTQPTSATAETIRDDAPKSNAAYQPSFFSQEEWAFVHAACAHIIPNDESGAGAIEAGVPEFLDRQMETPYAYGGNWYMQGPFISDQAPELGYQLKLTPRDIYRLGIRECNAWCQKEHGKPFADLPADAQLEVLKQLDDDKIALDSLKGSLFMAYLVKNTKEGYFADPIYGGNKDMVGWKMIGFPGARADFMDWIDHPNERYPLGPVSISGERG